MWKLKPSPRTIKATEKYIASLGRKREELTEGQWDLFINYVQNRRIVVPLLLFFALFCMGATFVYWHQGHKYYIKAIPNHTVTVSFDNQKESIALSPEAIKEYFNYVIQSYAMAWGHFLLSVMMFTIFIMNVTFGITGSRGHRILLSRRTETETQN